MHFYPGYTVEAALRMPWARFLALLNQIPALQAEDDLRALMVAGHGANPGERGKQLQTFARELEKQAGVRRPEQELSSLRAGSLPMVTAVDGSEIEALRARQRAATERMEQERVAQQQRNA